MTRSTRIWKLEKGVEEEKKELVEEEGCEAADGVGVERRDGLAKKA